MTFAENLMDLRKRKGLSQEGLGAMVGVSRQTVSKWELGATTPELDKLIALGDCFGISLDELVGRAVPADRQTTVSELAVREPAAAEPVRYGRWHYEYKSGRAWHGLPLVHINLCDRGFARARGVVAIGNIATGVVAIGAVAAGLISVGALSLGLLALGAGALGVLSLGGIALGIFALGGIAAGYLAIGGISAGIYAVGGIAKGVKVAVGEYAKAPVALDKEILTHLFQTDTPVEAQRTAATALVTMNLLVEYPLMPRWIARLLAVLAAYL